MLVSTLDTLCQKIKFSTSFSEPNIIKESSENPICFKPQDDKSAHIIALKAPMIKIQSLVNASEKLVIHTDFLIIDGGYITKPKQWDIQADVVQLKNLNRQTQWIASLIKENNSGLRSSTFDSQKDMDCDFELEPTPPLKDRFYQIANELKDFKNALLNWR